MAIMLTAADRAQLQDLLDQGASLLQRVESIEAVIASLLPQGRGTDAADLITDAIAAGWTVDQLLELLDAEDTCA